MARPGLREILSRRRDDDFLDSSTLDSEPVDREIVDQLVTQDTANNISERPKSFGFDSLISEYRVLLA